MAKLPSGYREIEYIQSSGTQYIDTGTYPKTNFRVVMDAQILETQTKEGHLASSAGQNYWILSVRPVNNVMRISTRYGTSALTDVPNTKAAAVYERHTFDKNKNLTYIDQKLETTLGTFNFTTAKPLPIFCRSTANGTMDAFISAKLYSCQIYDNGTLVRDFVPCKNSAGAAGLYDTANGKFYGNAGTGTFTAGPVTLKPPQAPTGVEQTVAVRLKWNPVDTAESYKIYRDGKLIGTTTEPAYTDTTAGELETYEYGIAAVNAAGESGQTKITIYTKIGYFIYKPVVETANFP